MHQLGEHGGFISGVAPTAVDMRVAQYEQKMRHQAASQALRTVQSTSPERGVGKVHGACNTAGSAIYQVIDGFCVKVKKAADVILGVN